jgi:hypothetical protein
MRVVLKCPFIIPEPAIDKRKEAMKCKAIYYLAGLTACANMFDIA